MFIELAPYSPFNTIMSSRYYQTDFEKFFTVFKWEVELYCEMMNELNRVLNIHGLIHKPHTLKDLYEIANDLRYNAEGLYKQQEGLTDEEDDLYIPRHRLAEEFTKLLEEITKTLDEKVGTHDEPTT